ncbi:hypothetical protein JCM33374_g6355 [Metschnikowia sp. JCM 33374]|nr:hypothetical protein JCM33374_g6355 [Metschnikowia sp. JCM 33374]
MDFDLAQIENLAIEVSEAAGKLLVEERQRRTTSKPSGPRMKMNAVDIVTETDEKIEKFIHDKIVSVYPGHNFVGEESYSSGGSKTYLVSDAPTWVVDPLDGTVNYVHFFPMVCVSIGFCVRNRPVVGVIHAPFLGQTYSASLGGGAWLNKDVRLPLQKRVLASDAPKGCIFACEWGKDRKNVSDSNLCRKVKSFVNMAAEIGNHSLPGMCDGVRSLGSAALDLCFVATGAFDIWWEGGCWEWDVCAGFIIVEEAGGLITTANPPKNRNSIPQVHLGGRLYLAIRAALDSDSETGREAQERTVRAVWDRAERLEYGRPL